MTTEERINKLEKAVSDIRQTIEDLELLARVDFLETKVEFIINERLKNLEDKVAVLDNREKTNIGLIVLSERHRALIQKQREACQKVNELFEKHFNGSEKQLAEILGVGKN